MPKLFLTPTEKKTILQTYSMNFEREFDKMGPYTFGIPYIYIINMCPEINKGKETGRILVNHFKFSSKTPVFIDVWERKDKDLVFSSRNLPGHNLISESEKVKVLEEKLEIYQKLDKSKADVLRLKGKRLSEYVQKEYKYWRLGHEEINRAFNLVHSIREEQDIYFRESPYYWDLIKERDDALMELSEQNKRNKKLEERLATLTDKLLANSKALSEEAEKSRPLTHNARGAGRKKDPVKETMRLKAISLKSEGKSREEIMKELGISRATYYRYIGKENVSDQG